jgi:hypothetical protein
VVRRRAPLDGLHDLRDDALPLTTRLAMSWPSNTAGTSFRQSANKLPALANLLAGSKNANAPPPDRVQ